MKTKHFIEEVEKRGFEVEVYKYSKDIVIYIEDNTNNLIFAKNIAVIKTHELYGLNVMAPDEIGAEMFSLMYRYVTTPISKREDEKKYYLKRLNQYGGYEYLNLLKEERTTYFGSSVSIGNYQTQFTKEEIEGLKMDERFLKTLEWEEVEND